MHMHMRSLLIAAGRLFVVTLVLNATYAHAEEIRVLSSVGIKTVVEVLGPQFEQATKRRIPPPLD